MGWKKLEDWLPLERIAALVRDLIEEVASVLAVVLKHGFALAIVAAVIKTAGGIVAHYHPGYVAEFCHALDENLMVFLALAFAAELIVLVVIRFIRLLGLRGGPHALVLA